MHLKFLANLVMLSQVCDKHAHFPITTLAITNTACIPRFDAY
ncbi:hypothetical protein VCRA2110O319_110116 [Vibrio crassostreae]|nr:hypothetical protein VCRA2110O319_110116 [Vibrio crassostreae]